jgi:hypothetical protein
MRRTAFLACFALLLLVPAPSWGQPAKLGAEFQVNTYTTSNQYYTTVGVSATGAFVVTWESFGQDGSMDGIFARRYDSAGMPLDGVEIQVNTYTTGSQHNPFVGVADSGDFVVTWIEHGRDGVGVVARRFASTGTPLDASEFQVTTTTSLPLRYPTIAVSSSGEFIVAWQGNPEGQDPWAVHARRYDSAGIAFDPQEFRVSEPFIGSYKPSLDVSDSGEFVVTWDAYISGDEAQHLRGRRFDSLGGPLGASFQIPSPTPPGGYADCCPSVGMTAGNGFVVSWLGYVDGPVYAVGSVLARRYDGAGSPLDAAAIAASIDPNRWEGMLSTEVGPQGDFVVAWVSEEYYGPSQDVLARRYDSTGSPLEAAPFQANTLARAGSPSGGFSVRPSVSAAPSGDFVVVWTSRSPDGDEAGVFGQRFACEDSNGNGTCDASELAITRPAAGEVLNCPVRGPAVSQPTIAWTAGAYDRFRVEISRDAGFSDGSLIDSGSTLLEGTQWQPNRGQWRRACRLGSEGLFIRVYGEDQDLDPADPGYAVFSDVVEIGAALPAARMSRQFLER